MSPMQARGYRCACIPCLFLNQQRGSAVTTVHQVAMLESRQKKYISTAAVLFAALQGMLSLFGNCLKRDSMNEMAAKHAAAATI